MIFLEAAVTMSDSESAVWGDIEWWKFRFWPFVSVRRSRFIPAEIGMQAEFHLQMV